SSTILNSIFPFVLFQTYKFSFPFFLIYGISDESFDVVIIKRADFLPESVKEKSFIFLDAIIKISFMFKIIKVPVSVGTSGSNTFKKLIESAIRPHAIILNRLKLEFSKKTAK
ncbi:hypothetical protein BpHYR1_017421, partial [Brachionus plicatilis]